MIAVAIGAALAAVAFTLFWASVHIGGKHDE
jgi:hypothetical protein